MAKVTSITAGTPRNVLDELVDQMISMIHVEGLTYGSLNRRLSSIRREGDVIVFLMDNGDVFTFRKADVGHWRGNEG